MIVSYQNLPMSTIRDKFTAYFDNLTTDSSEFHIIPSIASYHPSTLFCPAGMQRYTNWFDNPELAQSEVAMTSQACLRLNDLDFLGDSSHLAYFEMLGLFSWGKLTMQDAITFWLDFLRHIDPKKKFDRITIHPEKLEEWTQYYPGDLTHLIAADSECIWSDGREASGYCTEFYIDGIEVGNIVNTKGTMIDCGFGLERLEHVYYGVPIDDEVTALRKACEAIIAVNMTPSSKKQGYVLRKLLRRLYLKGGSIDHDFFHQEIERQEMMQGSYEKLKNKHKNKSPEWWFDTFGIDLSLICPLITSE